MSDPDGIIPPSGASRGLVMVVGTVRERELIELARRQVGMVTLAQCERAGVSRSMASRRVRRGIWQRVHQGIYKCGASRLTLEERESAALLAAGSGAALSFFSAATRWRFPVEVPSVVHVSIPHTRSINPLEGVTIHRPLGELAKDTVRFGSFMVTTRNRTILDLASALDGQRLRAVIDARIRQKDCSPRFLEELRACARREGASNLKAVLATYGKFEKPGVSVLESLASDLLMHVNGSPRQNLVVRDANGRRVGEVDFAWEDVKLVMDVDGREFHMLGRSFERDREKTNRLQNEGWTVYRFTYTQVTQQRDDVVLTLQKAYRRLKENHREAHDEGEAPSDARHAPSSAHPPTARGASRAGTARPIEPEGPVPPGNHSIPQSKSPQLTPRHRRA